MSGAAKPPPALIFDLDGTLLDSMGIWLDVDEAFLKRRGLAVPADYAGEILAMGFREAADYTIKRFGLPDSAESVLREWGEMAAAAYGRPAPLKPGAREYLFEMRERGAKMAIATSALPDLCEIALRAHGIRDLFRAVCNTSEAGRGKSAPDVFLLAARRLGADPGGCVVFEDILAAVKSAKSAGMAVCAAFDEASRADWEEIRAAADWAIRGFGEAPRF